MASIPKDWRKKILMEQIRVSVSQARMNEASNLLHTLHELEPENEHIAKELHRLEKGLRLHIATDGSENPYQCHIARSEEAARAIEARSQHATAPIPKARAIAEDIPRRITTQVIKFKAPTKRNTNEIPQQTEAEKINEQVSRMVQQYQSTPDYARRIERTKLRKHQRFLDSCLKEKPYAWTVEQRDSISATLNLLNREFKRRNREKAFIITISCALVLFAIIGLCACMLLDSAKRADIKLQYALIHENRAELLFQMAESDRAVYYFLYPQLKQSMSQARQWLSQLDQSQELVLKIVDGTRDIESLTQEELKALSNLKQASDEKSKSLTQRLETFKAQKLSHQEQDKLKLLAELANEVPAPSPLCLNLAEDSKRLRLEASALEKALAHFQQSKAQHGKEDSYMLSALTRQKEIQRLLQAIAHLEQIIQSIDRSQGYQQHVDLLRKLSQNPYPLAQQLSALTQHLPSLDEINQMMRYGASSDNQEILQQAEQLFLNDSPTFTNENPATAQQIDAMEQIFRARAFYLPLYQVIASYEGKVWLSESAPIFDSEGKMQLMRSKLDPTAQLSDSPTVTRPSSAGIILHQWDTTGLIKATDLTRPDFFRKAKILDTLSTILQYQDERCPALAQAFIYQQIITMMELHPQPALMGLSFSEQLRDDIKSFQSTLDQSGIKLSSQNWLVINPANKRAESLFREWFKQHRHHHYGTDCKRRLRAILFTEVRYAGYVNGEGQAILHHDLKAKTPIWYLDQKSHKICVGTLNQVPQAIPYSPLLYSASK
ncbi:MAG: hypothetical protein R3Y56_02900 [Akkermansia sp.]